MQGTVPQVAASGGVPPGAGYFSDANYYSLGSGVDALDLTGDFLVAVAFRPDSGTANSVFVSDGAGSSAGWNIQMTSAGVGRFNFYDGAGRSVSTVNTVAVGTVNVVCGGRASLVPSVKLNLGAWTTGTAGSSAPAGTSQIARIGRYESGGLSVSSGVIYEVIVKSVTPTDSACTAIANRLKSKGITSW